MKKEEAMKILKDFHDKSALFSVRTALDTIIPELRVSDDERIRKELIKVFSNREKYLIDQSFGGITVTEALAWLEKQEQKPAEWYREDEQNLNTCLGYIPDEFLRKWLTDIIHVKYDKATDKPKSKFHGGLGHQKPTWKASDEQLYFLHWLATNVLTDGEVDKKASEVLESLYNDLKKLKGE